VAMSASTADLANDRTDETQIQPTQTTKKTKQQQKVKENRLIIHYKHEKRFQSFKRDMHQVYEAIFKNTPVSNVKLIVGNRNRRDARNELNRKRPKLSLLKNISKKSKCYT
jgi:hypothetical protein